MTMEIQCVQAKLRVSENQSLRDKTVSFQKRHWEMVTGARLGNEIRASEDP